MKRIQVAIKGASPLLMHAYPMVEQNGIDKAPAAEQAEFHTYRRPDTRALYVPGVNLQRGLVAAAAFSKGKGRASLAKVAAAGVFVLESYCDLMPQEYAVDSRPVVIPATKGRIIRHRARFDDWSIRFTIEYDETLLDEKQMRRVVDDLGQRVGLLDFRPAKMGPFGRFIITEWKPA